MRVARFIFGLLFAVGLFAAPSVVSVAFAQDDESAPKASATFDETLLDIPEGETGRFYVERADAIRKAFVAFLNAEGTTPEEANKLLSTIQESFDKLVKKIAFADDVDPSVAELYFREYTAGLARSENVDELKEILKSERGKDKVVPDRVGWVRYLIVSVMFEQAAEKGTVDLKDAIKELDAAVAEDDFVALRVEEFVQMISDLDEDEGAAFFERTIQSFRASDSDARKHVVNCLSIRRAGEKGKDELKDAIKNLDAAVAENDYFAQRVGEYAKLISMYDKGESSAFLKRTFQAFQASESDVRKKIAEELAPQFRFADLVGNEMIFEGVYDDGSEIDWKSYRGKVVLVDFWATWCGPCVAEIPNVLELYKKYHDAGFDVVGYSLDDDLDALEKFEKERNLPWRTGVRKLSLEANQKDGKTFTDIAKYYGINAIPTMVLVDKDGKVLDTNARGEHLKELLEKAFPDVE